MKKAILSFILISFLSLNMNTMAQYKNRNEIPEKYKWNLSDLYKNNSDAKNDYELIKNKSNEISNFKGKLGVNAATLKKALDLYFEVQKGYAKLVVFANRQADEDVNISENQELQQMVSGLGTMFSEVSSFIVPELLAIPESKINQFYADEPGLEIYKFYIEDNFRVKDHTLSENEEAILASAGMLTNAARNVYNIFDNAEMPNETITLSTGEEVVLSASGFAKARAAANREDRKNVFKAKFETYKKFQNTFGANLVGKLQTDWFFAKTRKYASTLESSVDANNIPVSVYTNLIEQVNKNLPTLHRLLELKKRMIGVDELHYYDLYVSMVKSVEMNFTVDEGQKLLLDVFNPLGEEYTATVKKSFDDRWIDYYPTPGKRSGAYNHGAAYDVHPYILMNWTDNFNSLSTLAHELGHAMHSYFSNKNQPYVDAGYPTFVAEIASTINENFLSDYLVANAKTDDEKLYLLGSYLELLRSTIFRQTSFAEFEWEIHKKIENNEPLTGEAMSKIYYDIVKKYYGHDKGVCIVDDNIAYEWAYILHFVNYTYYVYQYSTSLIYATGISEKIKEEGQPAIEKYYSILKGGGSDYPVNLVKKAGIDPLSSEAFDLTIARMNKTMDMIEEILTKKKTK